MANYINFQEQHTPATNVNGSGNGVGELHTTDGALSVEAYDDDQPPPGLTQQVQSQYQNQRAESFPTQTDVPSILGVVQENEQISNHQPPKPQKM